MIASAITFEMLQARFVTGLDRRMTHLSGCLEALRGPFDDEDTPAVLDDMMRSFHSLAGIGGTYGYDQITDVASIGEAACQSLDLPVSGQDVMMLVDVLRSLKSATSSATRLSAGEEYGKPS
jgi:chemotaxis protein histidine kinase CheA